MKSPCDRPGEHAAALCHGIVKQGPCARELRALLHQAYGRGRIEAGAQNY